MRTLKTILATAITWAAISGLVYAIIRYFEVAQIILAAIGVVFLIVAIAQHWWEKFLE